MDLYSDHCYVIVEKCLNNVSAHPNVGDVALFYHSRCPVMFKVGTFDL